MFLSGAQEILSYDAFRSHMDLYMNIIKHAKYPSPLYLQIQNMLEADRSQLDQHSYQL